LKNRGEVVGGDLEEQDEGGGDGEGEVE